MNTCIRSGRPERVGAGLAMLVQCKKKMALAATASYGPPYHPQMTVANHLRLASSRQHNQDNAQKQQGRKI
jgi:hypothetical protein